MGLFGGSKSKSTTTSVSEQRDYASGIADNRSSGGGNIGGNISAGVVEGDYTVMTSDFGALQSAENIANQSLNLSGAVSLGALEFGQEAIEGGYDLSYSALQNAGELAEQSVLSGERLLARAIDTVSSDSKYNTQQLAQNIERSLAFATVADTSEGTQAVQSVIKVIGVALALGIVGFVVIRSNK